MAILKFVLPGLLQSSPLHLFFSEVTFPGIHRSRSIVSGERIGFLQVENSSKKKSANSTSPVALIYKQNTATCFEVFTLEKKNAF